MSLSVVESFKFNHQSIRAFDIKDVGRCLISKDVYTAVGYDKENSAQDHAMTCSRKVQGAIG